MRFVIVCVYTIRFVLLLRNTFVIHSRLCHKILCWWNCKHHPNGSIRKNFSWFYPVDTQHIALCRPDELEKLMKHWTFRHSFIIALIIYLQYVFWYRTRSVDFFFIFFFAFFLLWCDWWAVFWSHFAKIAISQKPRRREREMLFNFLSKTKKKTDLPTLTFLQNFMHLTN